MQLPPDVPVMILANATLFPQALLPLYIFEPRYRRMLSDVLRTHRMFCVAMQRAGGGRESPAPVAGLGLVRVSVRHADDTSHLILQGLARVQLSAATRYKPYRRHRIKPLPTPPCDSAAVGALVGRLRELLDQRLRLNLPFPFPVAPVPAPGGGVAAGAAREMLKYLGGIKNPEHMADLVSCAVLPDARQRQTILETLEVDARLRRLIQFLLADLRLYRPGRKKRP